MEGKKEKEGGKHAWLMLANLLSPLAIKNICANRKHQGDKTFHALISACPADFRSENILSKVTDI